MTFKAVAFDLDGTLVNEKSSWYKLHQYFGTYEQSKANMSDYEQGKITYDEFMRLDIGLWNPKPSKAKIESLLFNYTLCDNVKKVIDTLKKKGYKIFIITTAPDVLANAVATELGINNVASNGFIFDKNSILTQDVVFNVDLLKKDIAFKKIAMQNGLKCSECIAVGDSKYDTRFIKASGLGVGYKADEKLKEKAEVSITNMSEILAFI
jgi:phosphoserine phosphatase